MNATPIQWTESTWNPLLGCRRISPGCGGASGVGGCYAERLIGVRLSKNPKLPMYHDIARTNEKGEPRFTGVHRLVADRLDQPLRTRKGRKVFVCDMGDLFFEGHSFEEIAAVFGVMAACPQHTFQVLTKRAERMVAWFEWADSRLSLPGGAPGARIHPCAVCTRAAAAHVTHPALTDEANYARRPVGGSLPWPLPNVWVGVSVEDQRRAEERIPHLLRVPAAVRFLSVEPQLEAIDLSFLLQPFSTYGQDEATRIRRIHWVIQGGESGRGARSFHIEWMRSMKRQCAEAGVAWFPKQVGARPIIDMGTASDHLSQIEKAGLVRLRLADSHGGAENEWPEDLRGCRAFPDDDPRRGAASRGPVLTNRELAEISALCSEVSS